MVSMTIISTTARIGPDRISSSGGWISVVPSSSRTTPSVSIASVAERKVRVCFPRSSGGASTLSRARSTVVAVLETSPPKNPVRIAPFRLPKSRIAAAPSASIKASAKTIYAAFLRLNICHGSIGSAGIR